MTNSFRARSTLKVGDRSYEIWSLAALPQDKLARLPYSLKVLLENLLRFEDGVSVTRADIEALLEWDPAATPSHEIAFTPARVILQDFTGVPCVVDLAAMRDAIVRLGGNPERVNPLNPAELVIDHSVQVDEYGTPGALAANTAIEFTRNRERYAFLRWGQTAFRNLAIVTTVYVLGVVYLGAYVRHADASLGCLDWPLCNGQVVPPLDAATGIVFAHRLAALGAVILLWVLAYRARQVDVAAKVATLAAIFGVLQALSGALIVWTRLGLFSTLLHAGLMGLLFATLTLVLRDAVHAVEPADVRLASGVRVLSSEF